MPLGSHFGPFLDPLGRLLGRPWGSLGCLLAALRAVLGALGVLLGRSWDALGRSWAVLGRFLVLLGCVLAPLGASWPHLGASRAVFWPLGGLPGVNFWPGIVLEIGDRALGTDRLEPIRVRRSPRSVLQLIHLFI